VFGRDSHRLQLVPRDLMLDCDSLAHANSLGCHPSYQQTDLCELSLLVEDCHLLRQSNPLKNDSDAHYIVRNRKVMGIKK